MKRRVLGLIGMLVLAYIALVGWDGWINAHRIAAGPENETALYQNYDPEPVIKKFRYEGEGYGNGHGNGAAQLIKSIQHKEEFTPRFVMQADRKSDLMKALREDVQGWLQFTNTTVIGSHEEASGGFTYRYASGNSVGSISVQAPAHDDGVQRQYQLKAGLDDISVTIALEETWTRPASESSWWMAMVD